jgi:hypothetical protein
MNINHGFKGLPRRFCFVRLLEVRVIDNLSTATCGATSVNICCFPALFADVRLSPHRYSVTHDYIASGHICAICLLY